MLKVLVRYWKISCNLDNLSCFSWSGPFAVVGLIGDRGGSSRLKVAAKGEVGIDLDSNSTTQFKTSTSAYSSTREIAHSKGYLQQPRPFLRLPQLYWPVHGRCTCEMQDPSTQAFCPLSTFCVDKLSGSDEAL